jgi:hypothetical protein
VDLQQFQIKHDYYIHVKQIDDKMITVTFPENNTFKPTCKKLIRTYILSLDGLEILSSDGEKKYIKCPQYVKRVYVKQDISILALKYGISRNLILSYDKNGESLGGKGRVGKLLKKPDSEKQQELEEKLNDLIIAFLSDEAYQVSDDIADGFSILIKGIAE